MVELTAEMVRRLLGVEVDDAAASTLIEWYTSLSRGIAAFPEAELEGVFKLREPPLRSTPGPMA